MSIPDKEQIMAQVQQTAEQARDDLAGGQIPPVRNPVPHPITAAPAHEGIPSEYVLVVSTQICDHCGCGETTSQFFARYTTLGRAGTPLLRHLRACTRPEYNLPVKRTNNVPSKVPFCSECQDFNLSHLPSPPEPSKLTMPDVTMKGQKPKAAKPEPKKASIDDLI